MSSEQAERETVARQLELGARGYGAGAASRLITTERSSSFGAWHQYYAERMQELSVAVSLGEPALAGVGVVWAGEAMRVRGIEMPEAELVIGCMRESLREDLHERAWKLVAPALEAAEAVALGSPPTFDRLAPGEGMATESLRFIERVLGGRWRGAIDALTGLQDDGGSTRALYEGVLLPAVREVGTMWHLGEIGVGEEHAVTEAARSAMNVLWHRASPGADRGVGAVVGGVTEDRHDIGVQATARLMELAGVRSVCLGADLPAGEFVQGARDYEAQVAVIGATLAPHLPRVRETVEALREACPDVRVIVGGPAFAGIPGLAQKVGADAYSPSPGATADLVIDA
ncbi:MAG: B12-binding domain-containing protein [Phycisphaerales bacterium JB059]